MAVNSKQKGARFERALAALFREHGYKARRTAQYCGNTGEAADVLGVPGIHIEAKHSERTQLYDWMAQAVRDAAAGGNTAFPAVFHKKNNVEVHVTMRFDDWIQLYKEWEVGQSLKGGAADE